HGGVRGRGFNQNPLLLDLLINRCKDVFLTKPGRKHLPGIFGMSKNNKKKGSLRVSEDSLYK
ncbi:MAG: hypothetical protein ACI4DQ_02570, partial [Lachnospiraceae bacterium]